MRADAPAWVPCDGCTYPRGCARRRQCWRAHLLDVPPLCDACLYEPQRVGGVPCGTICEQDGACWRIIVGAGVGRGYDAGWPPRPLAVRAYVAYTGCMSAQADAPLLDEPDADDRMWRKVVAFTRDQEDWLKRAARDHPTEPGNVSAVIRDAVNLLREATNASKNGRG